MKTVFSNSEVPHVWARQSQEEGKSSGRNIYFTGPKIYSYGSHFCMGNIIAPGVVLLTDRSYSNSTAKHLGAVRYAVNHMRKLFVPHPEEIGKDKPVNNLKVWQERIKEHLETIAHPRKRPQTKEAARGSLAEIVRTVNEYLEITGQTLSKKWQPWNEDTRKEFLLYFAAAKDEQAAADLMVKLERARKAKERKLKEEQAELFATARRELKAWTEGKENKYYLYNHLDLPVRLRATDWHGNQGYQTKEIETSKGARVSYQAGKLLFAMIKAGKDVKGHDIDGYTVISINGVLKIGCHEIEMAEIHRFAKAEGWE